MEDDLDLKDYIGKHALLGINYRGPSGEITERVQMHGTILRVSKKGWLVLERSDGEGEFEFPGQLERAKPGEYELASTGEVVVNPDFMGVYTIDKQAPPDRPES